MDVEARRAEASAAGVEVGRHRGEMGVQGGASVDRMTKRNAVDGLIFSCERGREGWNNYGRVFVYPRKLLNVPRVRSNFNVDGEI